jgi:hypothetical protein
MWTFLLMMALAQEHVEGPDSAPAVEESQADLDTLEGQALYRLGLELVIAQNWDQACAVLTRVHQGYPDHKLALKAKDQANLIGAAHPKTNCGNAGAQVNQGQVELILSQSVIGPTLGTLVPLSFNGVPLNPTVPVIGGLTGLGAGIAGTWIATNRHPVDSGQAMAVYTGELLGAWNGFALSYASHPRFFPTAQTPYQFLTGGLLVGAGGGVAAAVFLKPTDGDMSLVRTGAAWGTYLAAASFIYLPGSGAPSAVMMRLLMGTDVGTVVTAVVATQIEVSRLRMNLINLAGYAGAAVAGGGLVIANFYAGGVSAETTGAVLAIGAVAGLGTGIHMTRNVAAGDVAVGALLEHNDGRWKLGVPAPMALPNQYGGVTTRVSLLRGRF